MVTNPDKNRPKVPRKTLSVTISADLVDMAGGRFNLSRIFESALVTTLKRYGYVMPGYYEEFTAL